MNGKTANGRWFGATAVGLLLACRGVSIWAADGAPLLVAASEPDVAAIVKEVGGIQVETFTLFHGCILKKQLAVDPAVKTKLLGADALVWTGFMPEAGAIRLAVGSLPNSQEKKTWNPVWINLSKSTVQVDPAHASGGGWCEGDVNEFTVHGDPFFRLNPENGAIMAREVARGLAKLRPDQRTYFDENAERLFKGPCPRYRQVESGAETPGRDARLVHAVRLAKFRPARRP